MKHKIKEAIKVGLIVMLVFLQMSSSLVGPFANEKGALAQEIEQVSQENVSGEYDEATASPSATTQNTPLEEGQQTGGEGTLPEAETKETLPEAETKETLWDEETCDHANENCINAPICESDHDHITFDIHGLPVPQCELGQWLLDRQDELFRNPSSKGEGQLRIGELTRTIDLALGDATIYRSGNYEVTNTQEGSAKGKLTIADSRIVTLQLTNTRATQLVMNAKAQVNIELREQNTWEKWIFPSGGKVTLTKGGALEILSHEGSDSSQLAIQGGSVKVKGINERDGRIMEIIPSVGTTVALYREKGENTTLATGADQDGNYYLWLPVLEEGFVYTQTSEGENLVVEGKPQEETGAQSTWQEIADGGYVVTISEGEKRQLVGEIDGSTGEYKVVFTQNNGTLQLKNVQIPNESYGLLVENAGTNTLHLIGENGNGNDPIALTGSGTLTISGEKGAFSYQGSAQVSIESGNIHWKGDIAQVTLQGQGVQEVSLDGIVIGKETKLQYNGASMPLVWINENTILLPTITKGERGISLEGQVLQVEILSENQKQIVLAQEQRDITLEIGKDYRLIGEGLRWNYQLIVPQGYVGEVLLHQANMSSVILEEQSNVTIQLEGINHITQVTSKGSEVAFAQKGNLLVENWTSQGGNVIVNANVKVVSGTLGSFTPITIVAKDEQGNPLANKEITLRVGGGSPYQLTTFDDGTFVLWRSEGITQQDIAVSDGENTLTAVIVDGQGMPDTPVKILNISSALDREEVVIAFDAQEANTAGVMYVVAQEKQDLKDTYEPAALMVYGSKNGGKWQVRLTQG
ncbi:MAG: hypothetical protein GX786_11125, partial [Clostridiales bacterium]|nr:hypothetical protein [Clostridiales bacterium]